MYQPLFSLWDYPLLNMLQYHPLKFKYADKLSIPYVIVIGDEEIQNNTVTLKNMETGEQETIALEEAIKKINN